MSLSEQFSIKVLGQEVCYFSLRLDKLIKFVVAICARDLSIDHDKFWVLNGLCDLSCCVLIVLGGGSNFFNLILHDVILAVSVKLGESLVFCKGFVNFNSIDRLNSQLTSND